MNKPPPKSSHKKHEEKPEHDNDVEILKAVAQAWHAHSSNLKTTDATAEFDAHRRFFKGKPSRFKIEAATSMKKAQYSWDFRQSLWDSYEIVSVSKKLETGLVISMDGLFPIDHENVVTKRRRESKNSLRSLFNRMSSSTRFTQPDFERK